MKKNEELKKMSIMEASDFWDEHDFSEFDDVKTAKDIRFSLEKKKYIGIDKALYFKIKKKAKKLHKSEDTLIKEIWKAGIASDLLNRNRFSIGFSCLTCQHFLCYSPILL